MKQPLGMMTERYGMTSQIDPSKPTSGKAYTSDVRDNFGFAKTEIELLQTAVANIPPASSAASIMVSPANPANTNSLSYRMMGLAGVITSSHNGKLLVTIDGQIQNSSQGQSTSAVICVGIGTPPVNGTLQTLSGGNIIGAPANFEAASNSSPFVPFSLTVLLQNIVAQTAYWIDLAVSVTGGIGTVSNLNVTAVEIL